MLSWITEKQDVWQRLQSCNKPVVVYGMGDGAVKILQVMQRYGIRPAAMFASDDFARGNSFMGYTVGKLRDVQAVYDDFIIVLAFAVRDLPTIERIRALSQQYELVAPDVPVAGVELFNMEFVRRHEQDFLQVEQLFADEQSRKVLHDMVNFKLSGKLEYLFDCETDPQEAYENILRPTPRESFADLGAYRGDTIAELMHYAGGCERVFAFEPDAKTYPKLLAAVEQMGLADRATCVQGAAKAKIRQVQGQALDELAGEHPVTLINMDVEGAERLALQGCRQVITRDRPKMLIAAYHRSEDLFALPQQIAAIRPDYRFYLRHYRYIPAWDVNLYCV